MTDADQAEAIRDAIAYHADGNLSACLMHAAGSIAPAAPRTAAALRAAVTHYQQVEDRRRAVRLAQVIVGAGLLDEFKHPDNAPGD